MQKTLENLSSVTFFFLIAIGGMHISSAFLLAEGVYDKNVLLIFQSLDLPFLMVALLYGSSRLALSMEEVDEKGKGTFVACCVFSAIVFLAVLYLNFAFPDAKLF